MSRNGYDEEAQFLCFCGKAHVKSISKILSIFLLLLCIGVTGFGFCSGSHTIVIMAGTIGCFSTLLLLLLIIGVLFDKASMLLPFLIVFGVYMTASVVLFVLYLLLGTTTDLVNYFYDGSDWLKQIYFDLQIDIKDNQVRTISCVILLFVAAFHSILVVFTWTTFFLAYLHISKAHKNSRQESGNSLSIDRFDHSPTTPLNTRLFNHNLFYADSTPSDFSQQ